MKPAGTQTLLQRLAASLVKRLSRHVTWHGSTDHNLAGDAGRHYPLVLILGREYYKERRRTYPALRRRDLEKVLRQELAGKPPTLSVPGPLRGDRREVSFYSLEPGLIESLPRSLFIIPESVVLGSQVPADGWADVERQDYRYFLFGDGSSQPAGGALAKRELVALAAGVDPDRPPDEWRGSAELLSRMRRALPKLPALSWWSCRNPLPRRFGVDAVAWRPVALTAAAMLFGYLVFSSTYLQTSLSLRSGALDTIRPEIQEGLAADEEARDLEARRNALAELWGGRVDTQLLWQGVALAAQNRASINQVEMREGRVRLYGEAADAAEILTLLAAVPAFEDVGFDSAVRSGRNGRQNFTLSFALAKTATDSEQADE
jgi:hypothetical protein